MRTTRGLALLGLAGLALATLSTGCGPAEPWTILCMELQGAEAHETASRVASALRKTKKIDPTQVRVERTQDGANLYYGQYERRVSPGSNKRSIPWSMEKDLELLKTLADPSGRRYFLQARSVPLPAPDVGHPEWDLRRADGVFSLQVAVYFNSDVMTQRKLAAAEKCKQLRDKGLEAYYYHGVTRSMVTVGTFGEDALLDENGQVRYVDVGGDRRQVAHHYSPEVTKLQENSDCKYNLTNDAVWYDVDDKDRRYPVRSRLVRIPGPEGFEP